MKKILCAFALSVMALTAFSQEIKIGRGQVLYHIPSPNIVLSARQHVPYNAVIQTVNVIPAKWKIVKFVNMGNQNTKNYDAMIIQSAGTFKKMEQRTYLLRYQDLSDEYKKIIDRANYKLDSVFVAKQNKLASLEDELEEIKISTEKFKQKKTAELNDVINNLSNARDSFINIELTRSLNIIKDKKFKIQDSLYNVLTNKEKDVLKHITFSDICLDTDSAGGNDIMISWTNISNKPIKYAYFTLDYYNRVDDRVYCTIRGKDTGRLKVTGWIEPKEHTRSYWDHIIYNYSADYAIVKNIQIIYKDGSTYNVSLTKKEFKDIYNYEDISSKVVNGLDNAEQLLYSLDDARIEGKLKKWFNDIAYQANQPKLFGWNPIMKAAYDNINTIYVTYERAILVASEKIEKEIKTAENSSFKSEITKQKNTIEKDNTEYEVNVNENWEYYFINM